MKNRIMDYLPNSLKSKAGHAEGAGPNFSVPDLTSWIRTTEKFVAKRPGAGLGVAFVVGVTLAWWIKRK